MNREDSLKALRLGTYLAFLIYGIFGILDFFMLPVNYRTAWFIRYAFVLPTSGICLGISYLPKAERFAPALITALLIAGQTGILAMIITASPGEPAFLGYYSGLILMILACEFIFRLPLKLTIIFFILSITAYTITAIFIQNILDEDVIANGGRWLIGNLFFMFSAGVISMMGTDRIHKEKRISENAKLQAEQANSMKSSFLANISHEIRTPLNGIIGYSKLVAEDNISSNNRSSYLEIINYSSNQLIEIVDSILHMAEIETGQTELQLQELNIEEFTGDIISEFSLFAENKNLDFLFNCNIAKKQLIVKTDAQKLRFILNNLINNALKFTDNGSVTVKCFIVATLLTFSVTDSGIGIENKFLDDIFKPFFQVNSGWNSRVRGNGLGLSICKSYCEILGGTIKVVSYPGKGSEFTVQLPLLTRRN